MSLFTGLLVLSSRSYLDMLSEDGGELLRLSPIRRVCDWVALPLQVLSDRFRTGDLSAFQHQAVAEGLQS